MHDKMQTLLQEMGDKFIAYIPNLVVGVLLIFIGWFVAWIVKRVIIQLAVILRLERYFVRFRWGEDLSRGDVRYGFYNFIGNIAFIIVLIIFVNDALTTWKLTIFSTVVERGIFFFPKLLVSLAIFGFGWLIAAGAARSIQKTLHRENVPRALLLSRVIKGVFILFFTAMALVELNIAREIVVIGFATIFITLGGLAIVFAALTGRDFANKVRGTGDEEEK